MTRQQQKKYLKALERRANWLEKVLSNWKGKDPDFAIVEHNALRWVIGLLKPLVRRGPAQGGNPPVDAPGTEGKQADGGEAADQ